MPVTVLGLPVHALVLHATVVLLPLTAALLVLCAFSAPAARRAGLLLPAAGLVAVVLVPVTVSSGRALRARLPLNPQIEAHARAGNALLPWAIGLAVMCLVAWAVRWRAARGGGRPRGPVGGLGRARRPRGGRRRRDGGRGGLHRAPGRHGDLVVRQPAATAVGGLSVAASAGAAHRR